MFTAIDDILIQTDAYTSAEKKMMYGKPIEILIIARHETFHCENWKSVWCEDGPLEADRLLIQLNNALFFPILILHP